MIWGGGRGGCGGRISGISNELQTAGQTLSMPLSEEWHAFYMRSPMIELSVNVFLISVQATFIVPISGKFPTEKSGPLTLPPRGMPVATQSNYSA